MEDKQMIPFVVMESVTARNERTIRNLITAVVITVILLFASNAIWVYEWTRYDYSSESVDLNADNGTANYIGESGDISYGMDKSEEKTQGVER